MDDEIEVIGKLADATTEVAKTGAKAIDAASDTGRFFNSVFGDLVIDGFGLLRDRLKFYRAEQWVSLEAKTRERLAAKGITDFRPVPPKIGLPLIENATIEDNDDLHSLWADLLTALMNPNAGEIEPRFVSAIKEMMPEDRGLLEHAWEDRKQFAGTNIDANGPVAFERTTNSEIARFSFFDILAKGFTEESIDRLIILGFFTGADLSPNEFTFTKFGLRFCKTVISNPTPNE